MGVSLSLTSLHLRCCWGWLLLDDVFVFLRAGALRCHSAEFAAASGRLIAIRGRIMGRERVPIPIGGMYPGTNGALASRGALQGGAAAGFSVTLTCVALDTKSIL